MLYHILLHCIVIKFTLLRKKMKLEKATSVKMNYIWSLEDDQQINPDFSTYSTKLKIYGQSANSDRWRHQSPKQLQTSAVLLPL